MGDASLIAGSVTGLSGNYGRYGFGSRFGIQDGIVTAHDALLAATARIDLVNRIASGVQTLADNSDALNLATAIGILTDSVVSAAANPSDAVRLLSILASYMPPDSSGAVGARVGARCRQCSISSLSLASESYYLTSSTDALTLLYLITDLIDAEILYCGNNFLDQTFTALNRLRSAVTTDILARGASLAPLKSVSFKSNLPAAVIAQRLYRDGSREDEIITRVDPPNPLFMPQSMTVLAR